MKTSTWKDLLASEYRLPYMKELMGWLEEERAMGKTIYPPQEDIYNALDFTPFAQVRVVILGQDPYHGPGQAHGLAFSVQKGVRIPPSLQNIYKELESDLGIVPPPHGNLEAWARQGVLMLNNVLTVEDGQAASHHGRGWEKFTDKVIELLNKEKEGLVFILWGSPAQKKASIVDPKKHYLIKSVHPSPLSAYRGFLGSKPFSKTNEFLVSRKMAKINWQLT